MLLTLDFLPMVDRSKWHATLLQEDLKIVVDGR